MLNPNQSQSHNMGKQFSIDGVLYHVDQFGVVHQVPPLVTQRYDEEYIRQRYDRYATTALMTYLRVGYVVGVIRAFQSLLDIGYGNGDFLGAWKNWRGWNIETWGLDISGYPVPEGTVRLDWNDIGGRCWDVVTMFDSLEHIPDLGFVAKLRARWLVVTAPWCHYERLGVDWFSTWKHRRPGEHLHHFGLMQMVRWLGSLGFRFVTYQSLEDGIRQPCNGNENTFTAVFEKEGWLRESIDSD
jgi:hypothetical protein